MTLKASFLLIRIVLLRKEQNFVSTIQVFMKISRLNISHLTIEYTIYGIF
jgi:hypothetical protein